MNNLNPKKILVIRPDAIGDCVILLPLLNVLRNQWPEAKIYLLASSYTAPFFEKHQAVDFIICDYLEKGKAVFKYFKFYRHLRREKFDIVIHSFNVCSYAFLTWLAGIPVRIGDKYKIGPNLFHNYKANQKFKDLTHHMVELNLDLLEPLGIKNYKLTFNLHLPNVKEINPNILQAIKDFDKIICFHLGTGGGNKPWLADNYAKLAQKIVQGNYGKVVLIGSGAKEKAMSEVICRDLKDEIINLVDETSIKDLIWVISKSYLFVGVDSGPMHIASAFEIPVLALAPTNFVKPLQWGPFGTNNLIVRPLESCNKSCFPYKCKDDFCLQALTVDQVFDAFLSLYNQKTKITYNENLISWLKASLNILIVLEDEKEGIEDTVNYLHEGGWSFFVMITNPKFKIKLIKKGLKISICRMKFSLFNLKTFLKLYDFIVKNDINLIHHFGRANKLLYKFLFLLTALKQYLPPKLLINQNRRFKDESELIQSYIKALKM